MKLGHRPRGRTVEGARARMPRAMARHKHRLSGAAGASAAGRRTNLLGPRPVRVQADGQRGQRGPWGLAGGSLPPPWRGAVKRAYRRSAKTRAAR